MRMASDFSRALCYGSLQGVLVGAEVSLVYAKPTVNRGTES